MKTERRWAEVEFLLRKSIESDEDVEFTLAAAEAGLVFCAQLEHKAKDMGILRGTLSRWLLPFDASTSVSEQAGGQRGMLSQAPEPICSRLTEREAQDLIEGANSVRRLVRIKIADDNDLETARTALVTAAEFLQRLSSQAESRGITPFTLLQQQRQLIQL